MTTWGAMTTWLKLAHIAALILWCGGLLVLPGLFALRPGVDGPSSLYRLQRFARAAYVEAISPAAFVAVTTGIALIFVTGVFTPWMALKLVAVGFLVMLHLRAGHVVNRVFHPGSRYPAWRQAGSVLALLLTMLVILWLVLAKPPLDLDRLPSWLQEPGALQGLVETIIPMP